MSTTTTPAVINWAVILEDYGPEAKAGLAQLLSDHQIEDDDAVAALIASMFISNMDSLKAYRVLLETIDEVTKTINDGKESLSTEFSEQIIALRGIIAFAREHIVESGEEQIEKRQAALLDVVKNGIRKALIRNESKSHFRNTSSILLMMGVVGAVSIASLLGGAMIFSSISSKPSSAGKPLTEIEQLNQERIEQCLANAESLDNKCVIELP